MPHFLLIYDLAPDYLDRRPEFRGAHLALAQAAVARGELLSGGALEPATQAVLLFEGEDGSAAEAFAAADPYVANGLVRSWSVGRWRSVVGPLAAEPL